MCYLSGAKGILVTYEISELLHDSSWSEME